MTHLRLYDYVASCNCYKVRLLLAQVGRDYERVPVDIFAGDTLTDEYGRINPTRTTPVLEVADGRFLPESAAILVYLAAGTPLLPDDPLARAEVVRWLIYEQTDVVPATGGLRFRLQTARLKPSDDAAIQRRSAGEQVLALLEGHLAGREFFAGDGYTIADIALYGYLHVAHEAAFDMQLYPRIRDWLERITEQPGYMNDLDPYPPNAAAGAGQSIYG